MGWPFYGGFFPGKTSGDIHNHVIREIYEVPGRGLWMLTNKGLSFYNNKSGVFKGFFTNLKGNINHETDISLTVTPDHEVYVWIKNLGLYQYDSLNDSFKKAKISGEASMLKNRAWRIHSLKDLMILVGENGNVWIIRNGIFSQIGHFPLVRPVIKTWSIETKNQLWLILAQRNGPSLLMNLSNGKVSEITVEEDNITTWSADINKNHLFAGSEKGNIYVFNTDSLRIRKIIDANQYGFQKAFTSRILDIYQDKQEGLFVGTDGNGVYIFRPASADISVLPATRLSYPVVRCFLNLGNKLLVGTKGGGINILNENGVRTRTITNATGLNNNSVLSLYERPGGSIWVGTDGRGLNIIDPDLNKISSLNLELLPPPIREMGSIYKIVDDGRGNAFLGTSGWGVIRIQYEQKNPNKILSATQLPLSNDNSGMVFRQVVYALALEKPGIIWVGIRGEGLLKFNYLNNRIERQLSTTNNPGLIVNDDILSLFIDHEGVLWAGSSGGMTALSLSETAPSKKHEVLLRRMQQLSVHSIQEDDRNNLWVTTSKGIAYIDAARKGTHFFDENDGLINEEYADGAGFFDPSTHFFYAGGTSGIDRVNTSSVSIQRFLPPLVFNKLFIADKHIKPGFSPLFENINLQKHLHVAYSQNSLSLEASPATAASKVNYQILYKLLPLDSAWREPGPAGLISLINLKPGRYTLEVTLSNEMGQLKLPPRRLEIWVDPPLLLSKPAIFSYIVLLILIQGGILWFYRHRAALKRKRALEELEKQKEKELQEYKIEFFTQLAHELRTPLTVINAQTYRLLENDKTRKLSQPLMRIYRNTLRLQKLVNEIMQFRRLEKGKESLQNRPCRIDEILEEILSDLEILAIQRKVSFEVSYPENPHLFCDRDKLLRILSNLISNAIKYNREGGKVTIKVERTESERIEISIMDEGEGFTEEDLKKLYEPFGITKASSPQTSQRFYSIGLGLAVTKSLTELMNGQIEISNLPEGGARAWVSLPVPYGESYSSSDTFTDSSEEYEMKTQPGSEGRWNDENTADQTKPVILVVDDDPEIFQSVADVLGTKYRYIYARSGIEALELLKTVQPNLIISDIMMPGLDGIELCASIRKDFRISHLPIILLTARAEIEDRISGLEAGADSYIPKPFHPEHLKVRVSKLIEQREQFRESFNKTSTQAAQAFQIPDPFLHKIIKVIDENLEDYSLNADYIADKIAISKSSLYLKLKNLAGITPHDLINKRRLEKAALLLKTTQLTVSEIIDQTGFNSRTYFYELFLKQYDCSPTLFRKKEQANQNIDY
ncbi:MAG: response regulator [Bacteroidales bacterium]